MGIPFFRGADCCVLVFDVTKLSTFEYLNVCLNDFFDLAGTPDSDRNSFPFIVIGNKIDLENRAVRPTFDLIF